MLSGAPVCCHGACFMYIIVYLYIYIYKAFRCVETLFIQGNVFIRPGPLLVGGIAPTNSGPGRIKTLPWMNKVSTCRKALYLCLIVIDQCSGAGIQLPIVELFN